MSEFFEDKPAISKLFSEIAEIKTQLAELDKERKKKEAIALAYIKSIKADKVETVYGSFTPVSRSYYMYSDEVTKMTVELSEKKKEEEATGVAKVKSTSVSLRFNELKEKE